MQVDYRRDGSPRCFMYEETLNFWLNGSINGGGYVTGEKGRKEAGFRCYLS